ncbi:MAG: FAD-binding oxidoreductase, partial [Thermoplasmata archaeon]|nr:FAD-binding oxidoreductase [Thermoplasmata archaeon]
EKSYIGSGASGRNGGGVRAQWTTKENIRIAKESIEIFRKLSAELGYNIWFRQGGYLFLAEDEEQAEILKKNARFHNENDLRTRFVEQNELNNIVPRLDSSKFLAGAFNPNDGTLFPFPLLWGYRDRIIEMGGEIATHTDVKGIVTQNGKITQVDTSAGKIRTDKVVNAAGKWSSVIGDMAGVKIPTRPFRHEILVTEPLEPFLGPMIVTMTNRLYMSQSMRGELIGGISDPVEVPSGSWESSIGFAQRMSREILRLFPRLGAARILRQWAGSYDVSPDNSPILGEAEGLSGFYLACGYSGHGLMISPAVGRMMADLIAKERKDPLLTQLSLSRFEKKGESRKETLVIG